MPEPESKSDLITRRRHFMYSLLFCIGLFLFFAVLGAIAFPVDIVKMDWVGFTGLSIILAAPLGIVFALIFSYPVHRFALVLNTKPEDKSVPLSKPARTGKLLFGWIGIAYLLLLSLLYIGWQYARPHWYVTSFAGWRPGLSSLNYTYIHRWTLRELAYKKGKDATPIIRKYIADGGKAKTEAWICLGELRDKTALEPLIAEFKSTATRNRYRRFRLSKALADIGDPQVIKLLTSQINPSEDDYSNKHYIELIGKLEGTDRIHTLAALIKKYRNSPLILRHAIEQMKTVRLEHFPKMPYLLHNAYGADTALKWYNENRDHIAWDAEKRKYYLKNLPEK